MSADRSGGDLSWSLARQGDSDAFGEIFDAHRERVYRHALRIVGDTHQAEDVTAVAFLELWRRRDSVRVVSGTVLPWLLVTTSNVAHNQRRSTLRYRRFLARLPRTEMSSATRGADLAGATLDLEPEVRTALASLRGPDLHLLVLVSIEDFTLAQAATTLGITEAAAKSRMHRIRTKIRDELALTAVGDGHVWRTET